MTTLNSILLLKGRVCKMLHIATRLSVDILVGMPIFSHFDWFYICKYCKNVHIYNGFFLTAICLNYKFQGLTYRCNFPSGTILMFIFFFVSLIVFEIIQKIRFLQLQIKFLQKGLDRIFSFLSQNFSEMPQIHNRE